MQIERSGASGRTSELIEIKRRAACARSIGRYRATRTCMPKSYADITAEINRGILKLRRAVPDAMAGFSALGKGALEPGALSGRVRFPTQGHASACFGPVSPHSSV